MVSVLSHLFSKNKNDLLTRPGCMEDCSAMHISDICWTIGPLHRQKLILASASAKCTIALKSQLIAKERQSKMSLFWSERLKVGRKGKKIVTFPKER